MSASRLSFLYKNHNKHGRLGKEHSESTKAVLSKKQKEHCEKFGNQFLTGKSKGKHSKESINKMSSSNTGKPPRWAGRIFQYDGPKGSFKMRSSYELFYARWLDANNIEWQYEPKFKLSNGKMFSPDFKLSSGVIIEIKGYWSIKGRDKWLQFCKDYPSLDKKILLKNDLERLGMKEK